MVLGTWSTSFRKSEEKKYRSDKKTGFHALPRLDPDTTGELCRKHCPHPCLLNATSWLRKLGRIISNFSAEQKAKQTLLSELEKHMVLDSRKKEPQCHICNRKTESPQDSEGLSRHGVSRRSNKSVEMQPLAKRPERLQTARRPRRWKWYEKSSFPKRKSLFLSRNEVHANKFHFIFTIFMSTIPFLFKSLKAVPIQLRKKQKTFKLQKIEKKMNCYVKEITELFF